MAHSWICKLAAVGILLQHAIAAPQAAAVVLAEATSDGVATATSVSGDSVSATEIVANGETASAFSSLAIAGPYVNLGYAKYKGVTNSSTGINSFLGIRYAKAPTGSLRWQPPQTPDTNTSSWINADSFAPNCPQSYVAVPGAPFIPGDEDCLFLNVYAPTNIGKTGWYIGKKMPVLIWIHGGGYGIGDGTQTVTDLIEANGNDIVIVAIQYRLGAFGFLSSSEVVNRGVANAGLLDQKFAMEWVQSHIWQFGGDKNQVTISGESAGAGSVMLHSIASDGSLGTSLFRSGIAASPYLPGQYNYDGTFPTSKYYALSSAVGCGSSGEVFDCLVSTDSMTLQNASNAISVASTYGTWAFYPVTEPNYLTVAPSIGLFSGNINGKTLLVGNNANEGPLFVPPTISSEGDLIGWLSVEFPNFTPTQINEILAAYPVDLNYTVKMETNGESGPTANEVSQSAVGQQQRGNNILAESTFVCPSYWLASAYSGGGRQAYHYQYSVPFAWHTSDIPGYFGPQPENLSDDFMLAFQKIWGNFIKTGNPSITAVEANGASSTDPNAANPATDWPSWSSSDPQLLSLNITGGVAYEVTMSWGAVVTQFMEPGLINDIKIADADAWEGGRGTRCDFWRTMSPSIPQ